MDRKDWSESWEPEGKQSRWSQRWKQRVQVGQRLTEEMTELLSRKTDGVRMREQPEDAGKKLQLSQRPCSKLGLVG